MVKKYLFFTVLIIFIGCDIPFITSDFEGIKDISHAKEIKIKNVSILCRVHSYKLRPNTSEMKKTFNLTEDYHTFIFGELVFANKSEEKKKYDITKVCISFNNKPSCNVYIQAPAHFIITEKFINKGETVKEGVYWVYEYKLNESDLMHFNLIVK